MTNILRKPDKFVNPKLSSIRICRWLSDDHVKSLPKRFRLNGDIIGFFSTDYKLNKFNSMVGTFRKRRLYLFEVWLH